MLLVETLLTMWYWLWGSRMRFWRILVLVISLHTSSSTFPLIVPYFAFPDPYPFHFTCALLSSSWNIACPHASFSYAYLNTHMQVFRASIHKWKRLCRYLGLGHFTEMLISTSMHLAVNFTASFFFPAEVHCAHALHFFVTHYVLMLLHLHLISSHRYCWHESSVS